MRRKSSEEGCYFEGPACGVPLMDEAVGGNGCKVVTFRAPILRRKRGDGDEVQDVAFRRELIVFH